MAQTTHRKIIAEQESPTAQKNARPFFRKSDFVLVGLVLALAITLFVLRVSGSRVSAGQAMSAEIYQANKLQARVAIADLAAGAYHIEDLPLEEPIPEPNLATNQIDSGLNQDTSHQAEQLVDYSLDKYVFAADGQGGIKIAVAPCPDKLCERGGYLRQAGDISICVPGQVLLKIVAQGEQDPDSELDVVIGQAQTQDISQQP